MVIEPVEFLSEEAMLRGLLFRPDSRTDAPAVVMAHGTSATVRMVADEYAEVFRRHGLAVLLYDHRNFGASGGEPRQEINPWIQCRGYLDAVDFVQTIDGIDRDRIALWEDSYSGGEVLVVGAVDDRVRAIVAQIPVCGAVAPALEPTPANFDAIRTSLLEPIQAFRWFIEHGARHGTGWVNRVSRVLPDTPVPYSPVLCAPFVAAPVLMVVAPDDEMLHANYDVARLAYELMPGPKEWHDIAGGHFGLLYHPSPLFDQASHIQAEFLGRWLS